VAQGAQSVPKILPERLDDRNGELIAIRVSGLRQSAHRPASRGAGVVRRQSLRARVGFEPIEVVFQL
jgi:hypothetical protein